MKHLFNKTMETDEHTSEFYEAQDNKKTFEMLSELPLPIFDEYDTELNQIALLGYN